MVSLPQGIPGWTVALAGLALAALRAYAAWKPREWIGWMEKQFVEKNRMRIFGLLLLGAAITLSILAPFPAGGAVGWLFILSVLTIGLGGLGLLALQNHMRHLIVASAEGSDRGIQAWSIALALAGVFMMLVAVL